MSQNRLPPPAPGCLWRPYSSIPNQKGGTLIAETVGDRETHERRLCDPDGYRPARCARCGHGRLHVHDYPERKRVVITLVRYLCPGCGATWRILPLFVARMLWGSWPQVEAKTLQSAGSTDQPTVPERTARRWRARLRSAATQLVQRLRLSADATLAAVAAAVGAQASRRALVEVHAERTGAQVSKKLSTLAATVHGLEPGVRLM